MTNQHTPTPWEFDKEHSAIIDKNGMGIAGNVDDADAAYIVKAVNCHEELVEALQAIMRPEESRFANMREINAAINNALAKAGAK